MAPYIYIWTDSAGQCVRTDRYFVNSFAYPDDITLMSPMHLLSLAFKHLMIFAMVMPLLAGLENQNVWWWYPGSSDRSLSVSGWPTLCLTLEIQGVSFDQMGNSYGHVVARRSACRCSIFVLVGIGMSYPGFSSEAKAHLWNTVCTLVMYYGMDCIKLNDRDDRKHPRHSDKTVPWFGEKMHYLKYCKVLRYTKRKLQNNQ